MELRFDAMLYSYLSKENSDVGHIKCWRGPQVPHPCSEQHQKQIHTTTKFHGKHWTAKFHGRYLTSSWLQFVQVRSCNRASCVPYCVRQGFPQWWRQNKASVSIHSQGWHESRLSLSTTVPRVSDIMRRKQAQSITEWLTGWNCLSFSNNRKIQTWLCIPSSKRFAPWFSDMAVRMKVFLEFQHPQRTTSPTYSCLLVRALY